MRPIEFRGKRFDNGEWVYGYYGQFHNCPRVDEPNSHQIFEPREDAYICGSYIGGLWHIVAPETIGQYIGRTDKYGTKIFEGDILIGDIHELLGNQNLIGIVEYEESAFIIRIPHRNRWQIQKVGFCSFTNYKVIGNIFDTPELLEKVEE